MMMMMLTSCVLYQSSLVFLFLASQVVVVVAEAAWDGALWPPMRENRIGCAQRRYVNWGALSRETITSANGPLKAPQSRSDGGYLHHPGQELAGFSRSTWCPPWLSS